MSESRRLDAVKAEILRRAAMAGLDAKGLPDFRVGDHGPGYCVWEDDEELVFSYREKTDYDEVIRTRDEEALMETVFVNLTYEAATRRSGDQREIDPREVFETPTGDIPRMAIALHERTSAIQEDLLGRIDASWRRRQAERNAALRRQIEKDFF